MKPNDPAALKALATMAAAHAVIYLPDEKAPVPVTYAGEHRGRAYYMLGDVPHELPNDLKAEVGPLAIAYYDGKALAYYVTPAGEAGEVQTGKVIDAIDEAREAIENAGGLPALLANY